MSFEGQELSEEQKARARHAFTSCGNDGEVNVTSLEEIMKQLGHKLTTTQVRDMAAELDDQGTGRMEWEMFLPVYESYVLEKQEQAFYKDLFRMLDKNSKGYITCIALKEILHNLASAVDLTGEEVNEMVDAIDEDGNGQVSFAEFYKLMTT